MPKIDEAVWLGWRKRAEDAKQSGRKTDADLAAEVSELVGYDVGRALVNHWFRGRRIPSLFEFMALCAALGSDPGEILLNVRMVAHRIANPEVASALKEPGQDPAYLASSAKFLRSSSRKPSVKSRKAPSKQKLRN